ncbi:MAG: hypothetical protein P8075_12815 [Deltaproteobacteria bacterium]
MKRVVGTVLLSLGLLFLAVAPVRAHFGMIIPADEIVMKDDRRDNIDLTTSSVYSKLIGFFGEECGDEENELETNHPSQLYISLVYRLHHPVRPAPNHRTD